MLLTKPEILKRVPHGQECLLIDHAIVISPVKAQAEFNCTGDEAFFEGHYPGGKILPGHVIIEAMGQTAALITDPLHSLKGHLVTIEKARFKKKLTPPFNMLIEAKLEYKRMNLVWFRCKAITAAGTAAEAMLVIHFEV